MNTACAFGPLLKPDLHHSHGQVAGIWSACRLDRQQVQLFLDNLAVV